MTTENADTRQANDNIEFLTPTALERVLEHFVPDFRALAKVPNPEAGPDPSEREVFESLCVLLNEWEQLLNEEQILQAPPLTEWEQVVDAWQLKNWEAYRDVVRLGRKTRLSEPQRAVLWSTFERVRAGLQSCQLITYADPLSRNGTSRCISQRFRLRASSSPSGVASKALERARAP